MNIADDVEGAVIELAVVPQRLPFNDRRINLLLRVENVDVAETLRSSPFRERLSS